MHKHYKHNLHILGTVRHKIQSDIESSLLKADCHLSITTHGETQKNAFIAPREVRTEFACCQKVEAATTTASRRMDGPPKTKSLKRPSASKDDENVSKNEAQKVQTQDIEGEDDSDAAEDVEVLRLRALLEASSQHAEANLKRRKEIEMSSSDYQANGRFTMVYDSFGATFTRVPTQALENGGWFNDTIINAPLTPLVQRSKQHWLFVLKLQEIPHKTLG